MPTLLNVHTATGDKDTAAASIVSEALLGYALDQSLVPRLTTVVPTIESGDLAADFTAVTLRLQPGILWSDGTPFTARDVVFTHSWIMDPVNNALTTDSWGTIATIEAVDDVTVSVVYNAPTLNWYVPFTGVSAAIIPEHYITGGGDMSTKPLGTGPFVINSFAPNDQIVYGANPNYRIPTQPYFQTVNMKGGGDPGTAAQSVIQTGDWDFAWNVAVEPEIIAGFESDDAPGVFRVQLGSSLERININFSDPRAVGPDGQFSYWEIPHPFLGDPAVRQAMALGVDRQLIVDRFYAPPGEAVSSNLLNGIPALVSPNTSWSYDPELAAQTLEDAGWLMNGDVREKDGVRLDLSYSTSINSVRQKTQQVVKANLESIGFSVNLEQVDAAIFFDSAEGNTQNLRHFYSDINVYTNSAGSPAPIDYMNLFYTGPGGENMAQASNGWSGQNVYRYQNPEYDALFETVLAGEITSLPELNEVLIQLNDIVIGDNAIIPLVNVGNKYCIHRSLIHGDLESGEDNTGSGGLDGVFWNIANWSRSEPVDR